MPNLVKLAEWFWRRSGKHANCTEGRTDKRTEGQTTNNGWSEKLTWIFGSGEQIVNLRNVRQSHSRYMMWQLAFCIYINVVCRLQINKKWGFHCLCRVSYRFFLFICSRYLSLRFVFYLRLDFDDTFAGLVYLFSKGKHNSDTMSKSECWAMNLLF